MRHLLLTSFQDNISGATGLIFKGTAGDEILADTDGVLLAHDLLEHQNGFGHIGCPADELEAMGGLWQVRGRHGTMARDNDYSVWSPIQNVGHEIVWLARDTVDGNGSWLPRLGRYRTRPHDHDEDFIEAIDFARDRVEAELRDTEGHLDLDAFFDNALHLMRRGFRKAQRRFGDGYAGLDLFIAVRDALRPHAKRAEDVGEGAEYRLSYGNGEAQCIRLLHPEAAW